MENEKCRLNETEAMDQPDGFATEHAPDWCGEDPLQAKLARAHAIATALNFELSE